MIHYTIACILKRKFSNTQILKISTLAYRLLHMAVWYHLVTTDVTSCSERLKVAVKCWLCCAMLQVAVCGCMSSFTIVSRIVLLIVFVCWCSLMLLDTSWGCMLSIGDYRCYKVQWVAVAVCGCMSSFAIVSCIVQPIVVVCWCGLVLLDVECCGVMLHVALSCQLITKDGISCSEMLQVVLGCWMLMCDAICCCMLSFAIVSHMMLLIVVVC